jgi:hypothetical protein
MPIDPPLGVHGGRPASDAVQHVWLESVDTLPALDQERTKRTPPTAQSLFDALDGAALRVGDTTWIVQVFSILMQGGTRWLQLQMEGEPSYTMTVKLPVHDDADHLISMLTSWLACPDDYPNVLNLNTVPGAGTLTNG